MWLTFSAYIWSSGNPERARSSCFLQSNVPEKTDIPVRITLRGKGSEQMAVKLTWCEEENWIREYGERKVGKFKGIQFKRVKEKVRTRCVKLNPVLIYVSSYPRNSEKTCPHWFPLFSTKKSRNEKLGFIYFRGSCNCCHSQVHDQRSWIILIVCRSNGVLSNFAGWIEWEETECKKQKFTHLGFQLVLLNIKAGWPEKSSVSNV